MAAIGRQTQEQESNDALGEKKREYVQYIAGVEGLAQISYKAKRRRPVVFLSLTFCIGTNLLDAMRSAVLPNPSETW